MPRLSLLAFCCSLGLIAAIVSRPWPGTSSDANQPYDVVVQTTDGKITAPLERITEEGSVHLGGAKPAVFKPNQVLSVRPLGTLLPAFPTAEQVILTNGDRIVGTIESISADELRLKPDLGTDANWTIPLNRVAVLWLTTVTGHEDQRPARQLLSKRGERDQVFLRQGDVLSGTMTGWTMDGLNFEVDKKEVTLNRNKIALVTLGSVGEPERPADGSIRVVLTNGTRLTLTAAATAGKNLKGKTWFDVDTAIPLNRIASIEPSRSGAVYLSDLKPTQYHFTPYLGSLRRDPGMDANADCGPLRVGGSTHDKGIGLHAACKLTFPLEGRYRIFEAWVGMDDETGRLGSVTISVLVDGKPRLENQELRREDGSKHVRIDVAKARELTLVVDFGKSGGVQPQTDWIEARLLP